jgi:hypothetical protein
MGGFTGRNKVPWLQNWDGFQKLRSLWYQEISNEGYEPVERIAAAVFPNRHGQRQPGAEADAQAYVGAVILADDVSERAPQRDTSRAVVTRLDLDIVQRSAPLPPFANRFEDGFLAGEKHGAGARRVRAAAEVAQLPAREAPAQKRSAGPSQDLSHAALGDDVDADTPNHGTRPAPQPARRC